MQNKEDLRTELKEWIEALENVILSDGKDYTKELLEGLYAQAKLKGISIESLDDPSFKNTVHSDEELPYPGNWKYEEKIRHFIRWNSLLMVLRANIDEDLGGHISTYSSAAVLYEVGFNHFFRGSNKQLGDLIYFQGHSSPGIYARSFLEGNISKSQIENFRKEINGKGLSSYPHPWLMPNYWQFPTVSMGLGPIFGIYQAHIMKYLEKRSLITNIPDRKVWVFCGDGEMDEPESTGAIGLAGRENLNNLVFVINCNLQRLDGPVRGNSKIVTELAKQFYSAGWNVVNLIWGRHWDDLVNADKDGLLQKVMDETVDGEYQNFKAKGGKYTRDNFFAKDMRVLNMVDHMSDEEVENLNRGGHDPIKVFNAYKQAYEEKNKPTVILAFTIKGYGIGSRQADNTTHQVKKLTNENLKNFIDKFDLPIDKNNLDDPDFLTLEDFPDIQEYLITRRNELGGYLPKRYVSNEKLIPDAEAFSEFEGGSEREQSSTMIFVRLLTKLLRDKKIGSRVVPIVPDEARTFGMDALFRQFGIYSSEGQKYEPEDADKVMYYRESESGIMLEEGINEAGAFSAWLALATSYSNNKFPMIPFYIFYSMFGFQRVHDLAYAAGDSRARGFLLGATSGRTTLNGEGLQHQDGHSHILASTIPNCRAYDPAFGYELAAIIQNGIKEMYEQHKDCFYYLTVMNENYKHPEKPKDATHENIVKGCYRFKINKKSKIRLLASGLTLNFAIEAEAELAEFGINADIWSITSFNELYRGGIETERAKRLEINSEDSYVEQCFQSPLPTIGVSEYQRAYPNQIRQWINGEFIVLGTDGFGRSDTRDALRNYFEINKEHIVYNSLLMLNMKTEANQYAKKMKMKIDKVAPWQK